MNEPALQSSLDRVYTGYERLRGFGDITGEVFEAIIQSFYRVLLSPGEVAMDLGACTGRHTIPLAHTLGPQGRVLAFEPLPHCRTRLEKWARDDGVLDRIQLFPVALAPSRGTAKFFVVAGDLVGHSSLRRKDAYPAGVVPQEISVETAPLDDFLPAGRRVSFLKADLEGGEFHALQGARRLLTEHRPIVAMESSLGWDSRQFGYSPADYFGFFHELKYELKDILGCPFRPSHALRIYPHYLVAYPGERAAETADALSLAVLENTFGPQWFGLPK
jgi:FkbM family methyltransferase